MGSRAGERTGPGRRWVPLVLSLALLLGLGAFGFSLVHAANASAEQAFAAGAVSKQRTVAQLADQYLQISAKEIFDFASTRELELTPGSAADAELLRDFLERQGSSFDHAAALTDLTGERLTVVGDVPDAGEPGYAPLRSALMRRQPGVSSVMWVDDVPVVAVGVPVVRDGAPAAVMTAFFRTDTSRLQRYSEQLGRGSDGLGMVIDGEGTVVAARHPDLSGTSLPEWPIAEGAGTDQAGHARFSRDGAEMIVTWAPITTGGWTLVEEWPAESFYASVRSQSDTARLAILGLLLAAGLAVSLLDHGARRARRRGEERGEALVKDASDVITILDEHGRITYASPAMRRVLGLEPDAMLGSTAVDLVHPDDLVRVGAAFTAAAGVEDGRQRIQARIRRADGTFCPCEVVICDRHADPSVRGTVVSIRDIAELVALHDQLSHQALHDPLTELPNRTSLERRMGEALAACEDDRRVAALFVDLDGFKAVNDELGHDRGDELLIQVADRLKRCLREGDTVARLGGDEFVIVLASSQPEEVAARIAARALDLIAEPFQVGDEVVTVGASIGIAVGDAGSEPETLLREADQAMYLAKERGRFRFEFPSAGMAGTGSGLSVPSVPFLHAVPAQTMDQPPSTTSV